RITRMNRKNAFRTRLFHPDWPIVRGNMPASSLSAYRSHRRSEVNPSRADITAIVSSSASLSVSGVPVAGRTGARSGQSRRMPSILTYIAVARVSMSFSTTRSWRPSPLHAGHPPGITHLGASRSSDLDHSSSDSLYHFGQRFQRPGPRVRRGSSVPEDQRLGG